MQWPIHSCKSNTGDLWHCTPLINPFLPSNTSNVVALHSCGPHEPVSQSSERNAHCSSFVIRLRNAHCSSFVIYLPLLLMGWMLVVSLTIDHDAVSVVLLWWMICGVVLASEAMEQDHSTSAMQFNHQMSVVEPLLC